MRIILYQLAYTLLSERKIFTSFATGFATGFVTGFVSVFICSLFF